MAIDDVYVAWGWTLAPGDRPPLPTIHPHFLVFNDYDPDGDALTVISYTKPTYVRLYEGVGGLDYDVPPNVDVRGLVDEATYTVSDSHGATATVYFVFQQTTPGNSPPVAQDDAFSTRMGVPLSVAAPGVLANDGDEQNDTLRVVTAGPPSL